MKATFLKLSKLWFCALFAGIAVTEAQEVSRVPSSGLVRREFRVEGKLREALVYVPASAKTNPTPVIFAFHGHGGSMGNAARTFAMHRQWPEAISVYMQGLNTPGRLTDPEGRRPGWQARVGDQGDRDLKFFDAVLNSLKTESLVDTNRIFATGHSNGGGFTYLLWEARGDLFAAMAPSGAAAGVQGTRKLRPKPALHIAGAKDPLVKFEWQKLMMDAVRRINGCSTESKPWGGNPDARIYESSTGTPLVTYIYDGGHTFPAQTAPELIVRFFKEHSCGGK